MLYALESVGACYNRPVVDRLQEATRIERWRRLTLDEQIGNVGIDVSRAVEAARRGDQKRTAMWLTFARAEFGMTLADHRWSSQDTADIARMRDLAEDLLTGSNASLSTASTFEEWWMPAAIRSNEARSEQRSNSNAYNT